MQADSLVPNLDSKDAAITAVIDRAGIRSVDSPYHSSRIEYVIFGSPIYVVGREE